MSYQRKLKIHEFYGEMENLHYSTGHGSFLVLYEKYWSRRAALVQACDYKHEFCGIRRLYSGKLIIIY